MPRLDQRIAAREIVSPQSRQVDRDALTGFRAIDRGVVHLHAPNPDDPPRRLETQHVARGDRPRPERAGRDRSGPR